MKNQAWSGTTNTHFLDHASQHRKSFTELQEGHVHVAAEIPNERSRVTYLLESITNIGPSILVVLAVTHQDENGKRVHFEDAVAFLAPVCPVLRNANKKKTLPNAHIVSTTGLSDNVKSGKGKTGVDLRYYPFKEFKNLPEDQQDELKEWQTNNRRKVSGGGKEHGNGDKNSNKRMKHEISSTMSKHDETFKAISHISESGNFDIRSFKLVHSWGGNAQVGNTTVVVLDPCVKFKED
mmetsp:Transcript_26475/g.46006  ORF Transcript_26475/g.46006 Transcript_26475/m.46006 type:complete len:237 (-) Transcript_26475:581-1291(-)|eukprot:CAMPEP_0201907180 /NCGR_PEP_ID=MMETSP0902-20130614/57398_1 /ASSEMBLY_ACC=CAM_ASM_000551 /TAXON_ID=420261 /ORGANISM="Thalassiosira antarctica, Strain CCMP982" /LENGTH=236 /DNA_ID=CAMNT_0048441327 /DNA_START=1460 /DNA_END=2170 /DNA_ORIENTATION=+